MKSTRFMFVICVLLLLAACGQPTTPTPTPTPTTPTPTEPAPTEPTPTPTEPTPIPKTIFTGTLSGSSEGNLEIVQTGAMRVLNLASNFAANGLNNIDLWLAKDSKGVDYIEFSDIKLTGAQTFDIAATVDLTVYTYVIIWCDEVDVVIGTAELMATP